MREPDHVVIVRYTDENLLERRVSYFARGADQARCLALSLTGSTIFAVSDTVPYVGATRAYKVSAVDWAPL